jgi:hypothetical protein
MQRMANYADWTEEDWRAFAKEAKKLAPGTPGTVGHELDDISEGRKGAPYPLFEMERGNALLLAVYHSAFTAVLSLLKKGFSANSLTSWTRLSALQFACMNGNTEISSILLKFGSDPSHKSSSTTMALEYTVKCGQVKLVEMLLALGHPQDPQAKRCVAYSGILLREQRKNRNKKRSTLIDIGSEDGEDGLKRGRTIRGTVHQQTTRSATPWTSMRSSIHTCSPRRWTCLRSWRAPLKCWSSCSRVCSSRSTAGVRSESIS